MHLVSFIIRITDFTLLHTIQANQSRPYVIFLSEKQSEREAQHTPPSEPEK